MKTRIYITTVIILLFCMAELSAQARFYDTDRTFHEQGFTYVSNSGGGPLVSLHNRDRKWDQIPVYRDGRQIPWLDPLPPQFQTNTAIQMDRLALSIINNAFTPAERQRISGERLTVRLNIDSQTGRVDDVIFRFLKMGGFATIPVSTYRRIELELKDRIQYAITDEGRRRTYLITTIIFEP